METILNVDNFDSTISSGITLVDFWANWCGPCKMLAPTVEEIASEYVGKLTVGKVNVDDCPSLATQYHIYSIPTLLLFVDGELKDKMIGYHLKREISAMLDKYL